MRGFHLIFLCLSLVLFLLPSVAYQQGLVPCSGIDCTVGDIFVLLVNIFNFLLGLSVVVLLVLLVFSGVRMILFHVSEQPESELINAKFTLTRAIVGFAIIAGAFVIVNTLLIVLGVSCATLVGNQLAGLGFLDCGG